MNEMSYALYKCALNNVPIIMSLQVDSMVVHQRSGGGISPRLALESLEPYLMLDVGTNHNAEYAAPILI